MLPIVSGIIFGLVFYKIIPAPFIFFGFIPFLFFLDRIRTWKTALLGGFLAGFVYFSMILYFSVDIRWFGFITSEALFMKIGYMVANMAGGIWWAIFALFAYFGWRRHWSMMFFIPALWIVMELLRRASAFGFTWGFFGYLSEDLFVFRQSATLFGVLGLGFLIIFINVGIYLILHQILKKDPKIILSYVAILGGVLLLVGISTVQVQRSLNFKAPIKVTVVQASRSSPVNSFQEEPYFSLLQTAKEQNPDLIVLPESLFVTWFRNDGIPPMERMEKSLRAAIGDFSGVIAFGAYRQNETDLFNSFFLWENGSIVDVYDKHYLVPFAEYRPKFFDTFTPKTVNLYTPGKKVQSFNTDSLKLGIFMCQESMHPESAQRPVLQGAELLISGANDGAGGDSSILKKISPVKNNWLHVIDHLTAKFRAIENGRYLVRSTKIGIASIISPRGEEIVRIDSGQSKVVSKNIYLINGLTPYTRFGDIPLLIASFLFIGWNTIRSIRRKEDEYPVV